MKIKTLKLSIFKVLPFLVLCAMLLCSCSITFDNQQSSSSTQTQFQSDLKVHFLDVGQGDSIFVELPNNKCMLIDAGENYYGEGIINYINSTNHNKIDYLVATHPHADHIGSMSYIVNHMDIDSVCMTKALTNTKTFEKLLTALQKKKPKMINASAGVNIINEDNLKMDVVAPLTIDEDNLNNCSVIIKLTYKNNSFLFTGDAEEDELSDITADISADVLKVGHHGSKTSTTKDFLKAVNPQIAVISLGKNNDYGHPHKSTMNFLKKANCQIYRTDSDGTITITSDGDKLTTETNGISIANAKK